MHARYIHTYKCTYIHRSQGTPFDKCGDGSGLPQLSTETVECRSLDSDASRNDSLHRVYAFSCRAKKFSAFVVSAHILCTPELFSVQTFVLSSVILYVVIVFKLS